MGFNIGGAVLGGAAGFATGGWGGAAAGAFAGGMSGTGKNPKAMSAAQLRKGHSEDTRSYKERDAYDWKVAQDRGLNVSEFYGSGGGSGSSSSGGAQVLGNSQDKASQLRAQQKQETNERQKDRLTQIAQTQMQTDSQQTVAKIQAGVQTQGQQNTATIASNALQLSREQLNLNKQKVAAELKISAQQLNKAINETITSGPQWQLMMKRLTMGPDNLFVEAYIKSTGIDPTKPGSFDKLSDSQKKQFLDGLIAYKSRTAGEISGIARLLNLSGNNPSNPDQSKPPYLGAKNKKEEIYSNPFFKIHKYTEGN